MDAILKPLPHSEQPTKKADTGGGKDSYLQLVPAVDQALRLLLSLAKMTGGEASLTELANEIGISRSKALAILNTLRNAGFVTRNDRTKDYRLGTNVLLLGRAFANSTDLARETIPYLEELAAWTGGSVHLGAISGETLFVIARRQAPSGMYLPIDLGTLYPLTWGAHGRAYLATLSPEELERRLGHNSLLRAGATDRDVIDSDVLGAQVEAARRLGYGMSLGTTWSGLNAVSTVLTIESPSMPGGRQAAACLVAIGAFSTERAHEIGRRMIDVASEMSQKLDLLLQTVNVHFHIAPPVA